MSNSIKIAAAKSQDEFSKHGPEVVWDDFASVPKAKERAKYVLTHEYANAVEMTEPFGYSQVIVDGEVRHEFFSNEASKSVGLPVPPTEKTEFEAHSSALEEIRRRFNLYKVGEPGESIALPGAIFTSREELRALAYFVKTLPVAMRLLSQAVDYVESRAAHAGKCLNAAELQKGIEAIKGISDISTGRDAFSQVNFEIGKARALTGQPGYQSK